MADYLLVPTNVQAFVVGLPGDEIYDLAPVPQNEDDVWRWYVSNNSSRPFINRKHPALASSVHLHWAVPAALMHARHEGESEPEQPCIPNRWLVVRMWHAADDANISSKAWVIESDYVSPDDPSEGAPFLFFGTSLPTELENPFGYVGRAVPAEDWQETHPEYRFELKSFGWGDLSFAAFYPACKGGLGFHDALEEVAAGEQVTYLVIGWYSDAGQDPLHPTNAPDTVQGAVERRARLQWTSPHLDTDDPPQQTLCTGGVVGVTWHPEQKYPEASETAAPTIAIGGSVADAFAALLVPDPDKKALQQVLYAFQHGQATEVTELDPLGDLLHRHSFSGVAGGRHWSIEPVGEPSDAPSSPPPVSDAVQRLLDKLNAAQQALDRHVRKIESLRSQLFDGWVTWASLQTGPTGGRPPRDKVDPATEAVDAAINELPPYETEVERSQEEVRAALEAEATDMQLAGSTMSPFLHPKDPFVVLEVENLGDIDRTRAQRSGEDANGLLPCRLETDVVTGVSQSGDVTDTWQAEDVFNLNPLDVGETPIGDVARALALETLLFDPNCASLLEGIDLDLFKELQESLDPCRESDQHTLTWEGQPPDPLGVTRYGERNPWLPIYLMWQVTWAPTYAPDDSHSQALKGWAFDPEPMAGDLVPKAESTQPQNPVTLEGATMISPLSGAPLAMHLREFAEAAGLKPENLEDIQQRQVLGQSLGGFNDLLLRHTLGLCLPPVDPENKEVKRPVWEALGQTPKPVMPATVTDTFLPVRVGTLKLQYRTHL